ncbi:MAG: SPOR domain-containing protein [Mariprofundaceae bacterium]
MAESQNWRATLAEHRAAWLIASASILLITVAMFWPGLFDFPEQPNQEPQASHQTAAEKQSPTYSAARPATVRAEPKPETIAPQKAMDEQPGHASKPLAKLTRPHSAARQQPVSQPESSNLNAAASRAKLTSAPSRVGKADIASTKGNYYVQTGAFRDKSHANRLAADIRRHGWAATVVPKPGHLYAVWVGPKANRSLAKTLRETLKLRLNLKGFIIQKKS